MTFPHSLTHFFWVLVKIRQEKNLMCSKRISIKMIMSDKRKSLQNLYRNLVKFYDLSELEFLREFWIFKACHYYHYHLVNNFIIS
jgi:hypothetical protein